MQLSVYLFQPKRVSDQTDLAIMDHVRAVIDYPAIVVTLGNLLRDS